MPKITFITHDAQHRVVDVREKASSMEAAVSHGVDGIVAECGGALACATCHVHVDAAWLEQVGPPGETESAMLELAPERNGTSRLACQIIVTAALDGLVLHVPRSQA